MAKNCSTERSKRMERSYFKPRPIRTSAATAALAVPKLHLSLRAKQRDRATRQTVPLPFLPVPAQRGRESGSPRETPATPPAAYQRTLPAHAAADPTPPTQNHFASS